jgi:hypothetical protein
MKTCPFCGLSIGDNEYKCWYCDADLKDIEKTSERMFQAFKELPDDVNGIIGAYGKLLDEVGLEKDAKLLQPISRLPYPKTKIEKALKDALQIAKFKTMNKLLQMILARLEDFIPDEEVPKDPDENFKSWLGKKDWEDPEMRDFLVMVLTQNFIKEYGDNAEQKVQEFIRDLQK